MSIAELQVQTQNISTALQYLSKRVDSLDPPNPDTPGEQDFLKKGAADKLYLSIQSAQSDYLLKTEAEKDYLTQLEALTEYMPIDGAFRYFPPCTYYEDNGILYVNLDKNNDKCVYSDPESVGFVSDINYLVFENQNKLACKIWDVNDDKYVNVALQITSPLKCDSITTTDDVKYLNENECNDKYMTQNDADNKYIPYEKIDDETAEDDKKGYKVCIDADRNRYIESKEKVINFIEDESWKLTFSPQTKSISFYTYTDSYGSGQYVLAPLYLRNIQKDENRYFVSMFKDGNNYTCVYLDLTQKYEISTYESAIRLTRYQDWSFRFGKGTLEYYIYDLEQQKFLTANMKIENLLGTNSSPYVTREVLDEILSSYEEDSNIVNAPNLTNYYTKTEADEKFALKTDIPEDVDLTSYYTKTEADEKFALKTESSAPDTSNYLEKQSLEWDIDDFRAILRLNAISRENGTHFFIEDSYYVSGTSGWYIQAYENKLQFNLNDINWEYTIVEFSENGINFKGDKLLGQSEADAKYVAKTELAQYATVQSNLDDYVTTQILEDVVEQINAKFSAEKRRWTFKLTMNANSNTATLDLSESIDNYNPVLSNSDGKHVLVYQETNNGFEMIVLTVTLSGINLSVQADKQSKNNYDIYLSFDQTS